MKDFRGKVIAITGAASGIGLALAHAFQREGARLALCDVDEAGLRKAHSALSNAGAEVTTRVVDVADAAAMQSWAHAVEATFGAAHVIVNNAGVNLNAWVHEMPLEDFRWLMDINFWGVVHGTHAFLPLLERAGAGHVVNVSSIFGFLGMPSQSAYNAAKFAVRGFTESLHMELAVRQTGVHVTGVYPGGVKTRIVRNARHRGSGIHKRSAEELTREFEEELARTSADSCARKILRGVRNESPQVLVGLDARFLEWGVRHLPHAHRRLIIAETKRRSRAQS